MPGKARLPRDAWLAALSFCPWCFSILKKLSWSGGLSDTSELENFPAASNALLFLPPPLQTHGYLSTWGVSLLPSRWLLGPVMVFYQQKLWLWRRRSRERGCQGNKSRVLLACRAGSY